jgi:hypothetical protein
MNSITFETLKNKFEFQVFSILINQYFFQLIIYLPIIFDFLYWFCFD